MISFPTTVLRLSAQWTKPEEHCRSIAGFPDTIKLDVNEGYEVLHFITRYMSCRGWCSEITFNNIETAIKTRLPFGISSHKDVKDWLDINFTR
jgi:hypothetical protein